MKALIKGLLSIVSVMTVGLSAHAASVLLIPTSNTTALQPGDLVSFEVVADFTTNNSGLGSDVTLGGGYDVVYDPNVLGLVSQITTSAGSDGCFFCEPDVSPGLIANWAIGNFNGITGPAVVGLLQFEVLSELPASTLLMTRATSGIAGPFISAIDFVTILDVEFGTVEVTTVPVPAAMWLLLSAVGMLTGAGRRREPL